MNGSTENTAHDASEKSDRSQRKMSLVTARRMLPLVRRVVEDVQQQQQLLTQLRPEQDYLDRSRRTLSWPQRQRRYQVHEEVAFAEQSLRLALAELEGLGVAILDPSEGCVGFPTDVNSRLAFFSWRPGEEGVSFWHFADESLRRPIPLTWMKAADVNAPASR